MAAIAAVLIFASVLAVQCTSLSEKELAKADFLTYNDARKAVMEAEEILSTGGRVILSEKEEAANRIFMKHKLAELSEGFQNPDNHAPGMHFFKAKELIENSKVYQFLKEMPKGGLLHSHNSAQVSSEWVIKNLTYMPGLLSCIDHSGVTILTFRKSPEHDCYSPYYLVSERRKKAANKRAFDKSIERTFNLYTPIPELEYPTLNKVWKKFQNFFGTISDVLKYAPAYRAYHQQLLEELHQDGVMYIELRMEFKSLYDEEGKEYPPEFAAKELMSIVKEFQKDHPDFFGVKVIFSTNRRVKNKNVMKKLETFKEFHKAYPNFVIGFDLVGQEDLGNPLFNFLDELKDLPPTAKYFFHAGETNWNGASTDYNLLDAILLNTTRIGHGYGLLKHPVLWNAVKKRDIAIEVSPISNQVLSLVWDLRNHPGTFFFSENIPVVITSDDPGFWSVKGMGYDYYYAIMSFAPNHAGLKTLKELVWNSIKYSGANDSEKKEAFSILEKTWDRFLDRVIAGEVLGL